MVPRKGIYIPIIVISLFLCWYSHDYNIVCAVLLLQFCVALYNIVTLFVSVLTEQGSFNTMSHFYQPFATKYAKPYTITLYSVHVCTLLESQLAHSLITCFSSVNTNYGC